MRKLWHQHPGLLDVQPRGAHQNRQRIQGHREKWIIQGHFGSTWQEGQYVRTREMAKVQEAFQDLLTRLQTDYIDLGMIHFVDSEQEFRQVMEGEFLAM